MARVGVLPAAIHRKRGPVPPWHGPRPRSRIHLRVRDPTNAVGLVLRECDKSVISVIRNRQNS